MADDAFAFLGGSDAFGHPLLLLVEQHVFDRYGVEFVLRYKPLLKHFIRNLKGRVRVRIRVRVRVMRVIRIIRVIRVIRVRVRVIRVEV